MNEYDSEKMADLLDATHGYTLAEEAEDADVILLNTCSIREKAQEKVFHQLGRWKNLKNDKPDLIIGVGGCVASQEGDHIRQRAPYVDIIFGPQTLHRLPEMIKDIKGGEDIECITIFNADTKEDSEIAADYILFFYGLNKKLGPINDWSLELAGNKIKVNTENFETDREGIFAVGDINDYPGKLDLILCGFHETTLAVQEAYRRKNPGERVPFGYTTSNTKLQRKLGVSD